MWPLFLLALVTAVHAQDVDLESIRKLEEKLPDYNRMSIPRDDDPRRPWIENKYIPPVRPIRWEKIKASGIETSSLQGGVPLIRLDDNTAFTLPRSIFVKHYELPDEHGFKYLVNNDGTTTYRIDTRYVIPIKNELVLYEPPHKYTPAPANKVVVVYDKKLVMNPEGVLSLGHVTGDYMRDLFNDPKARSGTSTQFAFRYATGWKLPLKVGLVANYERATYTLDGGNRAVYTAPSFGPQLKTKDLIFFDSAYRLQLQLRMSPFAKVNAQTDLGQTNMKFNSTDVHAGVELPMKNALGEFVVSAYVQSQWLNIKDQQEIVSVRASNKANTSYGLSLSQVFQ